MSQSLPPDTREPSNAEILSTLKQLSETVNIRHQQLADQGSTFHTMLKHQGNQIAVLTQEQAELKKELKSVDGKASRALGAQAELEGALLREVGVLAHNDKKQNTELAKQSSQLTKLLNARNVIVALVTVSPGLWTVFQWALEHYKP